MKLIVCTTSKLALHIIKELLDPISIYTYDTSQALLSQQPLKCGYACCRRRIILVKKQNLSNYDCIISIEYIIELLSEKGEYYYIDTCHVIMEDALGKQYYGVSFGIPVHKKYFEWIPLTFMITEEDDGNWVSMKEQLRSAIRQCWKQINHLT
jgi:hypothetical protein